MLKRKSQGLSINVIIIAALALFVLFILITVFSGRIKVFSSDLESCAAKQGECLNSCPSNAAVVGNTDCDKKNPAQKCCISVLPTQTNNQQKP